MSDGNQATRLLHGLKPTNQVQTYLVDVFLDGGLWLITITPPGDVPSSSLQSQSVNRHDQLAINSSPENESRPDLD